MMAEHDFFKLLRLGAGELDYLGPLVGFFRDASCVLAGRQRKHLAAKVGNAWLDRGVSEALPKPQLRFHPGYCPRR
jgi:hypothetical protein